MSADLFSPALLLCLLIAATALAGAGLLYVRYRRSAGLLDESFTAIPRPRQITDAAGRVVYANPACRAFVGGEQPVAVALRDRVGDDEEARDALERLIEKARSGSAGETEIRVPARGGAELAGEDGWYHLAAFPIPARPGAVLWFLDDITSKRQMEAIIQQEQKRFIDLIEHAPIGFYSVDGTGRFLFVNETLADWLELSREGLTSGRLRLHDLLAPAPDGAPPHVPFVTGDRQGEVDLRTADGGVFRALITQDVVAESPGSELRTRSVVRHLTRERAAEEALAQSERRFRRFFDEAPVGIVQLDSEARITECNKAFLQMVEMDGGIVGHSFTGFLRAEDRPAAEAALAAARRGADAGGAAPAVEVRLKGRQERVCSLTLRSLDEPPGEGGGCIAHMLDATERKALEAQFSQSQKMQAVGQLAGGIAHDFNNLLTAMIGFSDLLLLRHRPGDQSFADIMQIKQNANRAANLVRQLLAFSRQQTLQPRVLNVTDILAELSHLLRRLIGESIELKVVHGRDLGQVKADQGQLEQVIINLAVNARDAMQQGGKLTIRTSNQALGRDKRIGGEVLPAGSYVLMEVSDTGCGIPHENLSRIFDPFFSTKEVGEGTGLGLSTAYGIVKQTGGYVLVDSRVDQGTSFSIYLPQIAADVGEAKPEAEAAETRDLTGVGKVMLVEDEDAVRSFSARVLRSKGYNVLEARSGDEAMKLMAEQNGDGIDLLITDVVMPGMDGPAVVKEVRQEHPDLKVIFISGYAEDSFRKRVGEESGIHFLPKPFSLKQLASKVKEVMG